MRVVGAGAKILFGDLRVRSVRVFGPAPNLRNKKSPKPQLIKKDTQDLIFASSR
jgi:hypothetical protein